jgi:hypothetical protein
MELVIWCRNTDGRSDRQPSENTEPFNEHGNDAVPRLPVDNLVEPTHNDAAPFLGAADGPRCSPILAEAGQGCSAELPGEILLTDIGGRGPGFAAADWRQWLGLVYNFGEWSA